MVERAWQDAGERRKKTPTRDVITDAMGTTPAGPNASSESSHYATLMKYKIAAYAFAPLLGLTLVGGNMASAHGFFEPSASPEYFVARGQAMFQAEADLLGVTVDEIKNGWAQGKTLTQIAAGHGISKGQLQQKMAAAAQAKIAAGLQMLVTKGIITQAQADSRLDFLAKHAKTGKGKAMLRGRFRAGL